MEIKSCKNCKRLFNYITGVQICPSCKEELEKKFQEAKEYIRENKSSTLSSVAEKVGVPESQIREWVREERLIFSDSLTAGIGCEVCGTPIITGKYCEKCKYEMMKTLNSVVPQSEPPVRKIIKDNNPRMRFLDNR